MSNIFGWELDPVMCLKHGEGPWHRCDVRWLAGTAGGYLDAEGPTIMFFRFTTYRGLHDVHRRLFERGIKCTRFPRKVLAVAVPWVDNECDDCINGAAYEP